MGIGNIHPTIQLRDNSSNLHRTSRENVSGEQWEEEEEVEFNDQFGDVPRTKSGAPDRRYKGQRDLPDQEVQNPGYTKARVGGQAEDGVHLTVSGKPDRRFKENRSMSDTEAELRMAEQIIAKHQSSRH